VNLDPQSDEVADEGAAATVLAAVRKSQDFNEHTTGWCYTYTTFLGENVGEP
jgi:hypothetical protein